MPVSVSIDGFSLDLNRFSDILLNNAPFTIADRAMRRVTESHAFLKQFSANKLIYGINTGLGPMAQYRIPDNRVVDMQYNLIRAHSSGVGGYLEPVYGRAVLFNLLHAMLRGYSGVTPQLITLIEAMLQHHIVPCIPLHGSVGASGDLVQMAHVALALIGEGDVYYKGEIMPANRALAAAEIAPLQIVLREGLSIINGTTAMTAVGALNVIYAQRALEWSLAISMLINEIMESYDDHISAPLNGAKRQHGQQQIAAAARALLSGSQLIIPRAQLYANKVEDEYIEHKVQEYYSLRCLPQILGAVLDTVQHARQIVENELNSTTDNPVVDVETQSVYHGGNFHGDYISLEMDKLKLAVTRICMLAERQLNYLLNDKINRRLTPFVNNATLGLNFGFQGMQFTATSTTAECQALSTSLYVHSIPNNNDNQDIVSMGFNAACATRRVIDNTFEVLAIEAEAAIQAVDQLKVFDRLSPAAQKHYRQLREQFPELLADRPTSRETERTKHFLQTHPLNILF